jgi:hypothetical protein
MNPEHAGQGRQYLFVDPLELTSIGNLHAQQVVRTARHQKTFPDLWMPADRRLEAIEIVLRLSFEGDVDDHGDHLIRIAGVDQHRIAADHA